MKKHLPRMISVGLMAALVSTVVVYGTPATAQASAAPSEPAEPAEPGTVAWYLSNPEGPNGRRAVVARCRNDPGRLAQTRECINAMRAEERAFLQGPDLPETGNRRF